MRPILIDWYCKAGGSSKGYADAGFDVIGVDHVPQPNYPFRFVLGDAVALLDGMLDGGTVDGIALADVAVMAASPPCQRWSAGAKEMRVHENYPDLIDATRRRFVSSGRPWVIENIMPAPLDRRRSIVLCGASFGLRTVRHRRFEYSADLVLTQPPHVTHPAKTATKRRRELWDQGWNVSFTGDIGVYAGPEGLGIDWMNGDELCEAIPPSYTRYIGTQIMDQLCGTLAAA